MCGIAGIYNLNGENIDSDKLIEMTSLIKHRGPDDEGYVKFNTQTNFLQKCYGIDTIESAKKKYVSVSEPCNANLAFGFRRLSIIDLTECGHQPMCNDDESIWIVFNGEIYNYIELRNELLKDGYNFKSNSDTEVIIKSYEKWGTHCLNKFNGMWSFAIWDNRKKILFCARDRFGVKPFYYYFDSDRFIFGSEVKQILLHNINKSLDFDIIYKSLAFGSYLINSNSSYFKNIKILPHSHFLIIENNKLSINRYYNLPVNKFETFNGSFSDACYEYKDLFIDSVKLRMRSDVEVGSTLSGGLDSSAIVITAAKISPYQFKTFSSFYDLGPKYDERQWIEIIVKKTNSKSHLISASPEMFLSNIEKITWYHDFPLIGSSPVAQFFVMKLANENNIKVLLDGQGSDELTGGYNHTFYRYYADLIKNFKILKFFNEYSNYLKHHPKGTFSDKIIKTIIALLFNEQTLYEFELRKAKVHLTFKPHSFKLNNEIFDFKTSKTSNFLYNLMMSTSIQTLLHFEDRNSMAFSIESRVPFLDFRLVEFVFSLPSHFKIHNHYGKYIHRESLKGLVPDEIINRKDKVAFASPGEQFWLKNELKQLYDDMLDSSDFKNRGIYNIKEIKSLFNDYCNGNNSNAVFLWKIMALEMWFRFVYDKIK